MGNTPLTIGIKVVKGNNEGIVAGSILYGTIYLSNKQSSTVNAQSIQLKLVGREEASIHDTASQGGSGPRGREAYNSFSKIIYSLDHTIKHFPNGVLPRGQFEFPFALQLPQSLPSSMKAQKGKSKCAVYYEVVTEVYQKPNTRRHKNPHAKEEVIVVAVPGTETSSPLRLPTEVIRMSNCVCCSCFSSTKIGTMALEAKLDRSILLLDSPSSSQPTTTPSPLSSPQPTTTCHSVSSPSVFEAKDKCHNLFGFQFRCQNKSKAKVRAVKATFTEYIQWSVKGRTETVETILATSRRDATQYPELDAMWRAPFSWEEHRLNSEASQLLENKPWRTIDPSVAVDPVMVTDTFRGNSIRVRHVLTLSIIPEDCCTTVPEVSTTIKIYRNPEAFSHDGFFFEPRDHHVHSPSAPFNDEVFHEHIDRPPATAPSKRPAVSPTAPSSIHDDNENSRLVTEVPVVEALVLPEDWNAHTAELVTIPMVEAMVLEDTN